MPRRFRTVGRGISTPDWSHQPGLIVFLLPVGKITGSSRKKAAGRKVTSLLVVHASSY